MFFFHGNFDMVGIRIEKSLINDFSKTPIALHVEVQTGAPLGRDISSWGCYLNNVRIWVGYCQKMFVWTLSKWGFLFG